MKRLSLVLMVLALAISAFAEEAKDARKVLSEAVKIKIDHLIYTDLESKGQPMVKYTYEFDAMEYAQKKIDKVKPAAPAKHPVTKIPPRKVDVSKNAMVGPFPPTINVKVVKGVSQPVLPPGLSNAAYQLIKDKVKALKDPGDYVFTYMADGSYNITSKPPEPKPKVKDKPPKPEVKESATKEKPPKTEPKKESDKHEFKLQVEKGVTARVWIENRKLKAAKITIGDKTYWADKGNLDRLVYTSRRGNKYVWLYNAKRKAYVRKKGGYIKVSSNSAKLVKARKDILNGVKALK